MKLKLRSDSILASLTEPQLADLYDWILSHHTYADVQTRAARPVADGGLGLEIHITTLHRFYSSYTAWLRAREIADGEREALSSTDELQSSAATEIAHAIHDLARGPLKSADLKLVARYLQQQRDYALKAEYLKIAQHYAALATQKQKLAEDCLAEKIRQFEFNGAREVMKAYVAYEEIDKRTDIDEIDKIWEARKIAYGPRADETPKPNREKSTQFHAVPEIRLGPPGSRPASGPGPANSQHLNPHSSVLDSEAQPQRPHDPGLRTEIAPLPNPDPPRFIADREGFWPNGTPVPDRRSRDDDGFWPNRA